MVAFLGEHWDVVEGDWALHLHRDLLDDAVRRPVGVRKLRALLDALPGDSRTGRLLGGWTATDEQSALSVEQQADMALSLRLLLSAWTEKRATHPPPVKWPRPGASSQPVEDPPLTRAQVRAALLGR